MRGGDGRGARAPGGAPGGARGGRPLRPAAGRRGQGAGHHRRHALRPGLPPPRPHPLHLQEVQDGALQEAAGHQGESGRGWFSVIVQ